MGWREETRLSTLSEDAEIEVRCTRCGKYRYELAGVLQAKEQFDQSFMDQVQKALTCDNRYCRGGQVLALTHDHLVEGFVGGQP